MVGWGPGAGRAGSKAFIPLPPTPSLQRLPAACAKTLSSVVWHPAPLPADHHFLSHSSTVVWHLTALSSPTDQLPCSARKDFVKCGILRQLLGVVGGNTGKQYGVILKKVRRLSWRLALSWRLRHFNCSAGQRSSPITCSPNTCLGLPACLPVTKCMHHF